MSGGRGALAPPEEAPHGILDQPKPPAGGHEAPEVVPQPHQKGNDECDTVRVVGVVGVAKGAGWAAVTLPRDNWPHLAASRNCICWWGWMASHGGWISGADPEGAFADC